MREKYARLLREGKTDEATELVSNREVEENVSEEEDSSGEEERFEELNGVGPELASELVEQFGDFDSFVEEAEPEDLEPVPGIGEKRAESLVEQTE